MTGKYRFRSEAQGSDYSAVDKMRRPVSKDMKNLIAMLQEEAKSKESGKLKALLQKAIDAKTAADAPSIDDATAAKLAASVSSLGKELKSFIKEQGKERASNGKSISERIAALNMESMQRKQILALLKGIKDAQIDEFEPAGKGKRDGKKEERDDPQETKRNLLYNFLGPAGPLVKIWTDGKDEYKKWREQTAEAKEANDRESEELAEAETDLEKKQDKKVDKLAGHVEDRLKDLDKRVAALEEGEGGEGSGSDLLSRRRKSQWFRKTRVMAKRRWRLMKRAMKRRLRVTRVMGKRRFRLMRSKAIRAAKARARQLRILAKRKLRLSWRKLKKTKVRTAASRALRKLRASKAGRWLRRTWRKGGPLLNKAKGWASRGWGAAKGLLGKGKAAVGGSNFLSKFKGLADGIAPKGKGLWAKAAGAVKGSGASSKLMGTASKSKGLLTRIGTKLGGKTLGKLIPGIGSLISIYDLATTEEAKDTDDVVDKALAYGSGALSGATLGATIGSVVPGIGTAIGAVVGGVLGAAWVGIRRNWGTIKEWAKKGWELVKTGAAKAWEGAQALGKKYKEFMTGLWDIGANILKKLVSWLPAPVAKLLGLDQGAAPDASTDGGGGGGGAAPDASTDGGGGGGGGGGIGGAISDAADWVKGKASGAVSAVANSDTGKAVAAAYGEAKGVVSRGYSKAASAASEAVDTVSTTVSGALGSLSAKHEGKVNSANPDNIGWAFGKYQFNSSTGGLNRFFSDNPQYAEQFRGLTPGSEAFKAKWKEVAAKDHTNFEAAQDKSATNIWYKPAAAHASKMGYKVDNRGVQEAIFSGAINHGGIKTILSNAAKTDGFGSMSPEQQIQTFYAARRNYVNSSSKIDPKTKASLMRRYAEEGKGALAYAKTPTQAAAANQSKGVAPERKPDTVGMAKAVPKADNFKRTGAGASPYGTPQQTADATAYTRVQATSPQANVTVNPPPAPKSQEEKPGMFASAMSAIGGALGIRDVPMVLGDNHMVVLNSGMVGA